MCVCSFPSIRAIRRKDSNMGILQLQWIPHVSSKKPEKQPFLMQEFGVDRNWASNSQLSIKQMSIKNEEAPHGHYGFPPKSSSRFLCQGTYRLFAVHIHLQAQKTLPEK